VTLKRELASPCIQKFDSFTYINRYPAGGFIANIPLADAESTQMLGQLQVIEM